MRETLAHWFRRRPYYTGGGIVLIAALLMTGAARMWWIDRVSDSVEDRRVQRVEETLSDLAAEFDALRKQVALRAQSLAADPAIVRRLTDRAEDSPDPPEALIQWAADLRLPRRISVEVYDPSLHLLAWNGFSMPLIDSVRAAPGVLGAGHTTVISDENVRQALAVWWPVRANGRMRGWVRVMQIVRFHVPVQNRYISDYSLAEIWSRQTGYSVDVQLGENARVEPTGVELSRVVRTSEGATLARIIVQPPSADRLIQMMRGRFDDVLALWTTLLLFWGVGGGWLWYRAVERPSEEAPAERQMLLLRASGRFLILAGAWWGSRYLLLMLDVPARWQPGASKAPLAPLFDPSHLASTFGGGMMRSTGDLLLTGCFAALFTLAFLDLAARFRVRAPSWDQLRTRLRALNVRSAPFRFFAVLVVALGSIVGLVVVLAQLVQRAVLDSTLDFFARTGLLPEPLVLIVLSTLLLISVAVVLFAAGLAWMALYGVARYRPAWSFRTLVGGSVLAAGSVLGIVYGGLGIHQTISLFVLLLFLGVILGVSVLGMWQQEPIVTRFTLRSLLPSVIVFTVLLYPLLYGGMDRQRRGRMVDAALSFEQGEDPHVLFAIKQMLQAARQDRAMRRVVQQQEVPERLDAEAMRLLRESLLASLNTYEASVIVFGRGNKPDRRYAMAGARIHRSTPTSEDQALLSTLWQQYVTRQMDGVLIRKLQDRQGLRYAGMVPITPRGADRPEGWVLVRVGLRAVLPGLGAPFPRILLPEGLYSDVYAELSLAEFREGTLVRSLGSGFGRIHLVNEVHQVLREQPALWRQEKIRGRTYLTYYQHQETSTQEGIAQEDSRPSVVAVRVPAVLTFDHLYYLLRLAVAGLCIGIPLYLLGVYLRYRQGLLPAPRVRFRDKVLDSFLVVGTIAVVAVGFVGMRVVTGETGHAVESLLQQNLERVEETLLLEARRGEQLYHVAERIGIDSLAARVGIDLHLYKGRRLVATSRPRLVRDRLVETRLPVAAYQALYIETQRFTAVEERYGDFSYKIGFRTLSDEQGQPQYVLSVPTLPEQERIKEERARTLAYLFGALLILIIIVMLTALFLANALTKPIARLRAGLEAVGEGRFARALPVDTRDEIGELVQTFNEMREQLAESRRKLAQQEREMAWREMARQVAHEIKNPLTPMKLSVQHLRRAFKRLEVPELAAEAPPDTAPEEVGRFAALFDRITSTLIEQIGALARIADEFSTFARLPKRVLEPLDFNEVIREAAALMQEETSVTVELDLYDEPLVVEADQEEMRRIYINLIKNAIQAIPDEREGRIEITAHPVRGEEGTRTYVHSSVSDNGLGIPEEQRDKIFQPNFSTKTSGTGLGLAIAKRTVEELDGDIGFETEEGKGTTFQIRLPLAE